MVSSCDGCKRNDLNKKNKWGNKIMAEETRKRKWGKIGWLGIMVVIMLIIAGILCGAYSYYCYQANKGINKAAELMSAYLEQKYHKKFSVTNGHYIWATNSYTFDASPSDDPEFKFPAFINKAFDKGIGDLYFLAKNSRETQLLIMPYVNAVSKNNYFSAACDPATKEDPENKLLADVRGNMLTPEQMLLKYPDKIYMSTHISYALDVTEQNKEQIFKGVFNLVEFLKQKGFGYIGIVIYFFPLDSETGKKIINKTYRESKPGWTAGMSYSIGIGTDALLSIKKWQDIEKYFTKWDTKISAG